MKGRGGRLASRTVRGSWRRPSRGYPQEPEGKSLLRAPPLCVFGGLLGPSRLGLTRRFLCGPLELSFGRVWGWQTGERPESPPAGLLTWGMVAFEAPLSGDSSPGLHKDVEHHRRGDAGGTPRGGAG